jgi:hypothetical protein
LWNTLRRFQAELTSQHPKGSRGPSRSWLWAIVGHTLQAGNRWPRVEQLPELHELFAETSEVCLLKFFRLLFLSQKSENFIFRNELHNIVTPNMLSKYQNPRFNGAGWCEWKLQILGKPQEEGDKCFYGWSIVIIMLLNKQIQTKKLVKNFFFYINTCITFFLSTYIHTRSLSILLF